MNNQTCLDMYVLLTTSSIEWNIFLNLSRALCDQKIPSYNKPLFKFLQKPKKYVSIINFEYPFFTICSLQIQIHDFFLSNAFVMTTIVIKIKIKPPWVVVSVPGCIKHG